MKFLIPAILTVGLVLAEPEAPVQNPSNEGPYPPSGWKPSGRLLLLPARQQAVQVYGPPPPEYGTPSSGEADPATTDYPTTTPQQEESAKFSSFETFNFEQQKQLPGVEHGVYHVLLPDGRLQRVEYTTAPLKEINAQSQESSENSKYQGEQNKYQVDQYNQAQSGKFQQGQFEQSNNFGQQSQGSNSYQQPQPQFAQIQFQPNFPASFPQPVTIDIQQAQPQNSRYQQQAQFGFGSFQQSQSQQSQNSKVQQNKNQVKSQYPQQQEYDQNASQNQYNQKKYNNNKQQQNQGQAKQPSSSESNQYNNTQQEYQQVYLAQQQSAEQVPSFNGFVANVQYKDVEPISSPIYTYNPAPLVRVLRKLE